MAQYQGWKEPRTWRTWFGIFSGLIGVLIASALALQPGNLVSPALEHGLLRDSTQVKLFFVGDAGVGDANQKAVAEALEDLCGVQQPDAVVLLGDQFYEEGVQSQEDSQWNDKFLQIYAGPCLKERPFYVTLGNHDYKGSVTAQLEFSRRQVKPQWVLPERSFVVRFGSILEMAVTDTNIPDKCYSLLCSLDRLQNEIRASKSSWTVVTGHHPLFSGGKYRQAKPLKKFLMGHFVCNVGADFYLSGHDHNLQSLVGNDGDLPCSVHQIISGAGGARLYEARELDSLTEFLANQYGFVSMAFTDSLARYEFWGVEPNETERIPKLLFKAERSRDEAMPTIPLAGDEPH